MHRQVRLVQRQFGIAIARHPRRAMLSTPQLVALEQVAQLDLGQVQLAAGLGQLTLDRAVQRGHAAQCDHPFRACVKRRMHRKEGGQGRWPRGLVGQHVRDIGGAFREREQGTDGKPGRQPSEPAGSVSCEENRARTQHHADHGRLHEAEHGDRLHGHGGGQRRRGDDGDQACIGAAGRSSRDETPGTIDEQHDKQGLGKEVGSRRNHEGQPPFRLQDPGQG